MKSMSVKSIGISALVTMTATIATIAAIGLLSLSPGTASSPALSPEAARLSQVSQVSQVSTMQFPISFEANHGQTAAEVDFLARGPGYTVFLQPTAAVLSLRGASEGGSSPKQESLPNPTERGYVNANPPAYSEARSPAAALRMEIVAANPQSRPMGRSRLPGRANYFIGKDPKGWRTNVPTFGKVRYEEVYDGIDLVYYGTEQQKLEYDFVVAPGADPNQIALSFDGADAITLDDDGNLHIAIADNEVVFEKPYSYQEDASGEPLEIPSAFVLTENRAANGLADKQVVRFDLGTYDTARPLTIDPTLVYSSYLGGSGWEEAYDIAVDLSGNAIVVGYTQSLDFPVTAGSLQLTNAGSSDVFVTKVSAGGSTILYSTFVGGSDIDRGYALAIDSSGSTYVTGTTRSANFPVTPGALQELLVGSGDGFVVKLNATGDSLIYSTFFGGTDWERGMDIVVDGNLDAYVVSLGGTFTGSTSPSVIKINSSGSATIFSKSLEFAAASVAVDGDGNVFLAGDAPPGLITVNA